jgi:hypothetical protein
MESKGGTGVLQDAIRTLYEGLQLMVPPDVGYFHAYVRFIALPEVCILPQDPTVDVLLIARLCLVQVHSGAEAQRLQPLKELSL